MTAEEHAHVQELEGLVKRYRSRIVELKSEIEIKDAAIEGALRRAERAEDALKGRS